jgi:predicted TIM-barrel fold metal-dependent hydrolase
MSERIIDSECHPLVPTVEDLFPYMQPAWEERFVRTAFVLPRGVPHPGRDTGLELGDVPPTPEEFAGRLPAELEAAILIPSQVMPSAGWCDHALSAAYAAAVNDYVIDRWLPADARLKVAIAVAPHNPEAAAAEIRRHAEDPRVVAICTSLLAVNMGHRHYEPIYEAAAEFALPLVVHPGGSEGVAIGPPTLGGVGPRSAEERYTLLPQVAQANIASLIYDGIFTRFPRLKVVFAGFGFDWVVPLLWRADMEWRNLRIDVPWVTKSPSEYTAEHIRLVVDDLGGAPPQTAQGIAELVPEEVLLYGSDRPFATGNPEDVLKGIPEGLRQRVALANAQQTFPRLAVAAAA